ncbi:MAG: helix-hairpin-helix domain-containing protein [Gemmatimonadaceae bacterium]|nr:helix-hairpin-helix domain-containing protein [Gemmatimonadaceae bacterium]
MAAIDSARRAPKASRKSTRTRKPKAGAISRSKPVETGRAPEPPPTPEPLDINSATAAELERLPRVGPALAQRIVAYRDKHGPFTSGESLRHVRGIGPSTVRLLEPLVTFSGRHRP